MTDVTAFDFQYGLNIAEIGKENYNFVQNNNLSILGLNTLDFI